MNIVVIERGKKKELLLVPQFSEEREIMRRVVGGGYRALVAKMVLFDGTNAISLRIIGVSLPAPPPAKEEA